MICTAVRILKIVSNSEAHPPNTGLPRQNGGPPKCRRHPGPVDTRRAVQPQWFASRASRVEQVAVVQTRSKFSCHVPCEPWKLPSQCMPNFYLIYVSGTRRMSLYIRWDRKLCFATVMTVHRRSLTDLFQALSRRKQGFESPRERQSLRS